ncbi:TD and POZ domain-containing protein 1-like [Belonocnema kinseyi]|uniref:TD and POZ domain-containing protein 1-like n=1 Tax=Belonocnema kinseyi TaxID=2817044 RepID=UPI00143D57BF|nr:TD and POZ domain-containing protein 1-like [Belonocnema kinseyi]
MAGQLDALELMKVLPGVTLSSSLENNQTVYTLISVCHSLRTKNKSDVIISLQKDPEIKCSFRIKYCTDGFFRASIQFKSKEPYTNLKYKALLYSKEDNEKNLTFIEDLNLENITEKSIFYFSLPFGSSFRYDTHCYLFFQITRKYNDLTPMQIEAPDSEIIKDFSLLLEKKLFTDVKIICQDQVFSAHKLFLVARSPVFQAMFEHNMKESQEHKITITDIEPEIIDHLLQFIYTDTVEDLKEGQAEKLLAAADKYALERLKRICIKEIAKSIKDVQEGFDLLATAEKYNMPDFRAIVLDFVQKNFKKS